MDDLPRKVNNTGSKFQITVIIEILNRKPYLSLVFDGDVSHMMPIELCLIFSLIATNAVVSL
jgi:hypothetical protein